MAITRVGVGASCNGTSSISISAPAGCSADTIIAVFIVDHATSGTTSGPSGFTRRAGTAGTTASGRFQAFTGRYGDTGAGPWSFTGLTTRSQGFSVGYDGVNAASPIDGTPSARQNASGTTGTTSITPAVNGNQVLAGFATTANGSTWSNEAVATSPTLTERFDAANGSYCSIAMADGNQATAGATGASSASMGTSAANIGILLALKPLVIVAQAFSETWSASELLLTKLVAHQLFTETWQATENLAAKLKFKVALAETWIANESFLALSHFKTTLQETWQAVENLATKFIAGTGGMIELGVGLLRRIFAIKD